MATSEEIERLAQEIYAEKAAREAAGHGQGTVPWQELGESFKVSVRREAAARLDEGSR